MDLIKNAVILLVKAYQLCIRPLIGDCCRFYPTCSDYSIDALSKYGFFRGSWLTLKRLLKCNPFHPGGSDLVE